MKRELLLAVFAAILGFIAGKVHESQNQEDHRNQVVAALIYEMAQNQRIIRNIIEQATWREDAINASFPATVVSSQSVSDPIFFNEKVNARIKHGVLLYLEQIEAIRNTLQFLQERYIAEQGLRKEYLERLDDMCIYTLAITYTLQRDLDSYAQQRGVLLGYKGEVEQFQRDLGAKQDSLRQTLKRPTKAP